MLGLRMETIRFYDLKKLTEFLNTLYVEKEITVKIYLSGNQIFCSKFMLDCLQLSNKYSLMLTYTKGKFIIY